MLLCCTIEMMQTKNFRSHLDTVFLQYWNKNNVLHNWRKIRNYSEKSKRFREKQLAWLWSILSAYSHSLVIWDVYALYLQYMFFFSFISGEVVHNAAEVEEPLEDKFSTTAEWSPGPARPVKPTAANGHTAKRKRAETPGKHKKKIYRCLLKLVRDIKQPE